MTTVTCTHHGCGKPYDPEHNEEQSCSYHPGTPVFHEGLKSWSCCKSINKPVLSFDEFMTMPTCTKGKHTDEKPKPKEKPAEISQRSSINSDGKETYGMDNLSVNDTSVHRPPEPQLKDPKAPQSTQYVEENDPSDFDVKKDMRCKRHGCTFVAPSDDFERTSEECVYHPGHTIFHEGSKGWSCCKRRVLDFDDFLKIEGCRKGKHMFSEKSKPSKSAVVRVDHYQTPSHVMVSCFGKGANKKESSVTFTGTSMHVLLVFATDDIYDKTFELQGNIDPQASSYEILSTKCEISLKKADARSWPVLCKIDQDTNFIPQFAFSAGGGRGTVGAKDMVLDLENKRLHS